jgi:hypothetical protein
VTVAAAVDGSRPPDFQCLVQELETQGNRPRRLSVVCGAGVAAVEVLVVEDLMASSL